MNFSKKRVMFKNIKRIYLFYSNNIIYNNEKDNLWWNNDDYSYAIKSANEEITRLMSIHPSMERKYALKLLYQPNNISYDPANF
uniref:Uncharacterized protein n=1 Tax=viral metagenome TaxID=1070528 RepID=A0A6C0IDF3_9ZZZZ